MTSPASPAPASQRAPQSRTESAADLATYRLAVEPERLTWRCIDCGAAAILTVHPVLGGMGQGRCDACHTTRYFRRVAA
jgi:hypothetical protein